MKWKIALVLFVLSMTLLAAITLAERGEDYLGAYTTGYFSAFVLVGAIHFISK